MPARNGLLSLAKNDDLAKIVIPREQRERGLFP
jgi:hypothetical protein